MLYTFPSGLQQLTQAGGTVSSPSPSPDVPTHPKAPSLLHYSEHGSHHTPCMWFLHGCLSALHALPLSDPALARGPPCRPGRARHRNSERALGKSFPGSLRLSGPPKFGKTMQEAKKLCPGDEKGAEMWLGQGSQLQSDFCGLCGKATGRSPSSHPTESP